MVLEERSIPSFPFLHTAGWKVDVIAGAQVATLDYEAEVHVDLVEQEEKELRFLMTGKPILTLFC